MNKTELIDKIAAGAEISKAQAKAALDATTNALKEALIAGDKIQLVGFGTSLAHILVNILAGIVTKVTLALANLINDYRTLATCVSNNLTERLLDDTLYEVWLHWQEVNLIGNTF